MILVQPSVHVILGSYWCKTLLWPDTLPEANQKTHSLDVKYLSSSIDIDNRQNMSVCLHCHYNTSTLPLHTHTQTHKYSALGSILQPSSSIGLCSITPLQQHKHWNRNIQQQQIATK